jgi:hypothetical protein
LAIGVGQSPTKIYSQWRQHVFVLSIFGAIFFTVGAVDVERLGDNAVIEVGDMCEAAAISELAVWSASESPRQSLHSASR